MSFNNITQKPLFSAFISLPLVSLIYTMNPNFAYAENEDYYRQEPIFPIPLTVDVDIAKADLGEIIFFDKRLSKNNKIACSTCHQLDAGGDDNVTMGISLSTGQRNINTPGIFNAQYNFRQNWDGSIKTLDQQVDAAIKNQHEFGNQWNDIISQLSTDSDLTNKFDNIYKDGITKVNIIDALVQFEKTLTTPNSRFDRYLMGEENSLNKDEIKGYLIFKELGCVSCHQGINIGGNLYQKFGVFYNYIAERGNINKPDYGRMNITNRQIDKFVFKVPSLRNVAVTAPYLHDGSAKTLDEAINIMGKTQLGRTLTTNETSLIKAFLNSLTGEYKNKLLDAKS